MPLKIKSLQYILPFQRTFFWLGIWLLFYLRVTDYQGVGLLESTMFFIGLLIEIPSGAITDILGKKLMLALTFILTILGNLIMAFSTTYEQLFLSVLILVISTAFFSGTAEALVYDSLKDYGKEAEYDRFWAKVESNSLILLALSSIIGGYLYTLHPSFPFIATSVTAGIGLILCLIFIEEPDTDTKKHSISTFLKQNIKGFSYLFDGANSSLTTLKFLAVVSFASFLYQFLDDAYAIEIGYQAEQLGTLFGVLVLISAISGRLYPFLKQHIPDTSKLFNLTAIFYYLSGFASIVTGIISGSLVLVFRVLVQPHLHILATANINKLLPSKARATGLSTFALLKLLPYVASIYILGDFMEKFGTNKVIFALSCIFLLFFIVTNLIQRYLYKNPHHG